MLLIKYIRFLINFLRSITATSVENYPITGAIIKNIFFGPNDAIIFINFVNMAPIPLNVKLTFFFFKNQRISVIILPKIYEYHISF